MDLPGNAITDTGASDIAEALEDPDRGWAGLTTFRCGSNPYTVMGATQILRSLQTNESLTHLDMGRQKLGPKQGAAVAEALGPNRCLRVLMLEFNSLGDDGARPIGAALAAQAERLHQDPGIASCGGSSYSRGSASPARGGVGGGGSVGSQSGAATVYGGGSVSSGSRGSRGSRGAGGGRRSPGCLQTLGLASNGITNTGAAALVKGAIKGSLTRLFLAMNKVGPSAPAPLPAILAFL